MLWVAFLGGVFVTLASLAVAADMRRKLNEAVQREAFRRECERRRAPAGSWN